MSNAMIEKQIELKSKFPGKRFGIDSACSREIFDMIAKLKPWQQRGPDVVSLIERLPESAPFKVTIEGMEAVAQRKVEPRALSFATTFHATERGIECVIGRELWILKKPDETNGLAGFFEEISQSNVRAGIALPMETHMKPGRNAALADLSTQTQKRFTTAEVAEIVGVTRRAIDKRIRRLARDGWIEPSAVPEPNQRKSFDPTTAEIIRQNPKGKKEKGSC